MIDVCINYLNFCSEVERFCGTREVLEENFSADTLAASEQAFLQISAAEFLECLNSNVHDSFLWQTVSVAKGCFDGMANRTLVTLVLLKNRQRRK